MPGNGGTPFNEPSPLLPSDGAPLREDSPPADLDSKQEKNNSLVDKRNFYLGRYVTNTICYYLL